MNERIFSFDKECNFTCDVNGMSMDIFRKVMQDCEYHSRNMKYGTGAIDRIISNDPATIIIWKDGSKTVVKCMEGDTYNVEMGIAMCILKHFFGTKYNDIKKLLQKEDTKLKELNNAKKDE